MAEKKKQNGSEGFVNVAVPRETYKLLTEMKARTGQTIKHQLNQCIRKAYFFYSDQDIIGQK